MPLPYLVCKIQEVKAMKRVFVAAIAICTFAGLCPVVLAQAQSGTQAKITFVEEEKEKAREQLRRLLAEYDLDPWIFTQRVKIETGVDPHSHPILTLNTDFLDDDDMQLSVFLHEQAHWFVSRSVPHRAPEDGEEVAVIQDLRQMYPNSPFSDYGAYLHLIVGWVELDAMAELIGEEKARQLLEAKVKKLTGEPISEAKTIYRWYNGRVLEDTDEIGAILAKHALIVTPEKGLVIETNEE